MKLCLILLSLLFAGCALNQPEQYHSTSKFLGLDAEKYQVINISKFDNETTSCGMDKLLQCLDVSEETCHKIYRAAAVDCFDTFYTKNGSNADICSPINKDFIDGCMYRNVLKYGKGGISQAIRCMEST